MPDRNANNTLHATDRQVCPFSLSEPVSITFGPKLFAQATTFFPQGIIFPVKKLYSRFEIKKEVHNKMPMFPSQETKGLATFASTLTFKRVIFTKLKVCHHHSKLFISGK